MTTKVADILCELIAAASVNPRLAADDDPTAGEGRMTEWLGRFCDRAGWRWATQSVHPGRANIVALVPGGLSETLLWEAHQDTVSAAGMKISPFAAEVRDGRVYGRGACDVKGGMAAMLTALVRLAAADASQRPSILFAATVNEECGFTGARALADLWRPPAPAGGPTALSVELAADGGLSLEELCAMRPDAALVAEPTELDVVVAHRGVVRWRAVVHGRAAHSSRPEQGANAIYAMADVVQFIEAYHRVELAARPADPWCGPPTACVTTIHGGSGANTVPDRAIIDVDRRLAPTESPDEAYQQLTAYVAERMPAGECQLEHEPPWMRSRGLSSGANRAWAERVAQCARSVGAGGRLQGVPYGTNAASIAAAGIPAVVFGPGSINQAHTADEWIAIDQLEQGVEALYRLASGAVRP